MELTWGQVKLAVTKHKTELPLKSTILSTQKALRRVAKLYCTKCSLPRKKNSVNYVEIEGFPQFLYF